MVAKPLKNNAITEGVIWKQLLIFFFPLLLGAFFQQMYNMADSIIVGRYLGKEALSAVGGSTGKIVDVLTYFSVALTTGSSVIIAQYYGAKNYIHTERAVHTAVTFAALFGLVVTVLGFALTPAMLKAIDTPDEILKPSITYLRIYFIGMVPNLLYNMGAAILRAIGDSKRPLIFLAITCFLNIIIDLFFVVVLNMGVAGAAYATVASQFVSALVSTLYFFSGKSQMKWTGMGSLKLSINIDVIKTGMAPAILQLLSFITGLILNNQLRKYGDMCSVTGDLAISAMSVVTTAESVFLGVVMGINQAVSPIVSYNYGAGKYKRVLQGTIIALITGTIFTTISWALMMFVPQYIFKIFSNDVALISYGVHAIRLYRAFSMFMAVQTLCAMFFSSIGEPKTATVMSVLRQGVFLIPGYLILPVFYGLDGVLVSMSISDVLSTIIILVIYILGLRKLEKKRKEGCYE